MPYTLLKFLLWFGLAAFVGGVIGWLLRSVKSRGELATTRPSGADDEELARLRQRLANMDEVVAERDRLRIKVAELRTVESTDAAGNGDDDAPDDPDTSDPDEATRPGPDEAVPDDAIPDDAVPDDAGPADDVPHGDEAGTPRSGTLGVETGEVATGGAAPDVVPDDVVLDVETASTVLGKPVALDDLTVVEGIGPKISELCRGINIESWRDLAGASLDELRSMLDAAGPRYQVHKPDSWPLQAELLATGQWEAFKSLADSLAGGR